jgi:hypothetical protein
MNFTKYRTLVEALDQLSRKGFTHSFKLIEGKLANLETGKSYRPEDLRIVEYHRFEGDSNPADMSVVFAVKCCDGRKGTIVSSYGTYADMPLITFLDKVKILDRTEVSGKA